MRIGICGTHCAGKTTLVRDLKDALPDYNVFIEDAACDFAREDRKYIETQKDILRNQIEREDVGDNFVSDRTVIDNLVYSLVCDMSYATSPITTKEIIDIVDWYLYNNPYDIIFFVDEYFELEDNGNRDMDHEYQRFMYCYMKMFIRYYTAMYDIPLIHIVGDREVRVAKVLETIIEYEVKNGTKTD